MNPLKEKVKEIFAKYDGGNSYVVSEMHHYLNEKKFSKAKKIMIEELHMSEEDAKVLISYYKKRMNSTASFVEISVNDIVNDIVPENPDDPVDSETYLFVYGQGIYQSSVYQNPSTKQQSFFADRMSHDVLKARQIFRIDWTF